MPHGDPPVPVLRACAVRRDMRRDIQPHVDTHTTPAGGNVCQGAQPSLSQHGDVRLLHHHQKQQQQQHHRQRPPQQPQHVDAAQRRCVAAGP